MICKVFRKKLDNFFDEFQYSLSFCKSHVFNDRLYFLVYNVVFNLEKSFHAFFENLIGSNVINFGKCVKPLEMGEDLVEGSPPVCRIFKLVFSIHLRFMSFLHFFLNRFNFIFRHDRLLS